MLREFPIESVCRWVKLVEGQSCRGNTQGPATTTIEITSQVPDSGVEIRAKQSSQAKLTYRLRWSKYSDVPIWSRTQEYPKEGSVEAMVSGMKMVMGGREVGSRRRVVNNGKSVGWILFPARRE